jgi:hypothetical protein
MNNALPNVVALRVAAGIVGSGEGVARGGVDERDDVEILRMWMALPG